MNKNFIACVLNPDTPQDWGLKCQTFGCDELAGYAMRLVLYGQESNEYKCKKHAFALAAASQAGVEV